VNVNEEGITIVDAFSGMELETLSEVEFRESADNYDFEAVSQDVIENPNQFLKSVLIEAASFVNNEGAAFHGYDPIDVEFVASLVEELSYEMNMEDFEFSSQSH
jgi:hypothetical protein